MSIEDALAYEIENDTAVAALSVDDVRPGRADYDDETPFITYTRADSEHQGHQGGDAKLDEILFRIECVADTYKAAYTLGDAVFAAINRFQGQMGDTVGGNDEDVRNVIVETMSDALAGPSDGSEKAKYVRVLIARVSHRRT